MGYRPYHDGAPAQTAAQLNSNYFEGWVTVNTEAELTALLSPSTISGVTFPAVPQGTFALRTDNDTLYLVNSSSAWEAFADFSALRSLGRPNYPVYDTAGAYLGRVSMSVAGTTTTFLVENAAGTDMFRFTYNTAATGAKQHIQAPDASGLQISSLNASYNLTLTDTETLLSSVTGLKLKAATLLLEDAAGTGAPLLSLAGTSAGAMKALGTNASGAIEAYDRPTPYPAFMPQSIPGTAMPGDGIRLNAGRTAMEFGPVAGTGGGDPAESFFTPSLPAATRSAVGETQVNIAAGTLSADHPFTVASNGIVVAAGTDEFFATLDYVLDIHPTAWHTPGTGANQGPRSGGNRLFIDVYWKKDGTIVQDTRISHYIRGDEDWAPGDHKIHGNFSELLEPGTYTLWVNRTVAGGAGNEITGYEILAANSDIHIVTPGGGGGSGSTTFLGLTDTPSAFEAGKWLRQTATGLESVDAPAGSFTPTDDSIPASAARASTLAYRQEWLDRLDIPIHETVTSNSFVIIAGVRTNPALTGFITSPVTGSINGSTSGLNVRIGGTLYSISALYQINAAGGTQNNIAFRISPDPATDISAEWQLQVGALLFNFADATTATDAGGRVTYSWTGNTANIFEGGQSYNCALRIPAVEQFATLPIQASQITGTFDPTQFRDNSISYRRAIAGTPAEQAGWRTKAGFAAFASANNRVLKYVGTQVVQAALDVYDLDNVVPTANLVAPAANQIAIWTTSGLDSVATLGRNHLPPGTATGQILEWDGTAWQLITTPSGGTGGVTTFAGLTGRWTYAQAPAVSATDNGKFLGVTGGAWSLYEPALSGFGSGNLPTTRLSGNLSALRIDFTGLTTNQQNSIKSALNITSGSAQTIMFGAVGTPELDLYTTGSTASTFTFDPEKQANFRHALGVTNLSGYNRYRATLVAATTGGGDIGFSAASPMVGTLTAATGFTGRNLTIAGNSVRVEGVLYGDTGGDDYVQLYLTGTITETPDLILKVNGHDLASGDTSSSASDNSYGAAGWLLEWDNVPSDLMVSGTTYTIEIDAGLEAEIDSITDNLRTLPANPTTTEKKVLAANNAGAAYETLSLDGADEADFILNVTAVNRPNQNTTIIPLSGSGASAYFTRSGNYLTARKAGWSHVAITVYPGAANTGQVKIHARVSNRDVLRSDRTVEHYRDVISWIFPYNFAVGDTLSFWYEARDVPAASNAASVPATPAITVTEDDANFVDRIQITSPSTGLFNYIEISKRVHGAGTTQWTDWETLEARVADFYVDRLYRLETDYRIRLGNSAGVGRFRQWLAGAGTTTTEEGTSAYGQTVNFNGNLHISRPSITIS